MKESIASAIGAALDTGDPVQKVMTTRRAARDWRLGRLEHRFDRLMPDRPARPDLPLLLPPNQMPRRRGGSQSAQMAMIHALAHIEFVAIDLALDMAGRFGSGLPPAFVSDWLSVAADEAMHFALLDRRLRQLGSHYGAMPAHDGLWEAAESTTDDVLARIALVPMVLEARGLDMCPATIERFEKAGDNATARIVRRILNDEIRHVATGTHWFARICESLEIPRVCHWQRIVSDRFRGSLKPPFNDSARDAAGLTRDYYHLLAGSAAPAQ